MKQLTLLALAIALCACGNHSEFDVTPDQVAKKAASGQGKMGLMPDMNHLPPGAVKTVHKYKKGDVLPDGSIADRDRTVTMVTMNKNGPGMGKKVMQLQTEDVGAQ